jgi:hypothetical protein
MGNIAPVGNDMMLLKRYHHDGLMGSAVFENE